MSSPLPRSFSPHGTLDLPSPTISPSTLLPARVLCSDGSTVETTVLHSHSGAYYEIGETLKLTIYGQTRVGMFVELLDAGHLLFRRSGPLVAVKVYSRALLEANPDCPENLSNEIGIMQLIKEFVPSTTPPYVSIQSGGPYRYPNLVHMIECCMDSVSFYNIMEFVPGKDLCDLIEKLDSLGQHFPEELARKIFRNILDGVQTLHSLGVFHRDISLENLMITDDLARCVVIDYGLGLLCQRDSTTGSFHLLPPLGPGGKRRFKAPELYSTEHTFDGSKADIWALGVVLFMILTNKTPMDNATVLDDGFRWISTGRLPILIRHWGFGDLSAAAVDLLTKLLDPVPSTRITLSQILDHPWMNVH